MNVDSENSEAGWTNQSGRDVDAPPRAMWHGFLPGQLGPRAAIWPTAELLPQTAPTDVDLGDWDDLLGAVTARLRLTMGEPPLRVVLSAAQVCADVLDCADALEQLHMTLRHEVGYRQREALELFHVRTELAQLRADLASSRCVEQQSGHRALHDHLTLLPNREYFLRHLARALAHDAGERTPLAVLVLGLEGLRPDGDEQGECGGDRLLRIAAARLSQALRGSDMASHLGADTLACLLPDFASQAQLRHLACKLFDAVTAPVKLGRVTRILRPSIGIVCASAAGDVAAIMLDKAHVAMARARLWQTGYAFYDPALDD